jgi:hypothetical protein
MCWIEGLGETLFECKNPEEARKAAIVLSGLKAELIAEREKNKVAVETLKHYADEGNWTSRKDGFPADHKLPRTPGCPEPGSSAAQEALAKMAVE